MSVLVKNINDSLLTMGLCECGDDLNNFHGLPKIDFRLSINVLWDSNESLN